MSWQEYVDDRLVGSGHLDKAAIIGINEKYPYAFTPGFTVKPEEINDILAILAAEGDNDKPAVAKAQAEGVHVAGERYVAFNIAADHIYGRKGKTGVIIVKSKTTFIVGQYGEDKVAGNASAVIEAIAKHLRQ